jgi:hypothetical protein
MHAAKVQKARKIWQYKNPKPKRTKTGKVAPGPGQFLAANQPMSGRAEAALARYDLAGRITKGMARTVLAEVYETQGKYADPATGRRQLTGRYGA